jgi:AcrR family transcriptional regulator
MDSVVDAACELLDSHGWERFTFRRVAASLDVTPSALYQHVASKEQLLDLVADRYLAELIGPGPGESWGAAMESFAHELRQLVLRRPLVAHVMLHHQIEGHGSYAVADRVLRLLHEAGFDSSTAVELFTTTSVYTLGFALHEHVRRAAPTSAADRVRHLRTELADELPAVASAADEYARWWSEKHFSSAVARIIGSYRP